MHGAAVGGGPPALRPDLDHLSGDADGDLLRRYRQDGGADGCLLYTSDAADDLLCVDLGGRRILKKKKNMRQEGEK